MDFGLIVDNLPKFAGLFVPGFFYVRSYQFTSWDEKEKDIGKNTIIWSVAVGILADYIYNVLSDILKFLPRAPYKQYFIEIIVLVLGGLVVGQIAHSRCFNKFVAHIFHKTLNDNLLKDTLSPGDYVALYGDGDESLAVGSFEFTGDIFGKKYISVCSIEEDDETVDVRVFIPLDDVRRMKKIDAKEVHEATERQKTAITE